MESANIKFTNLLWIKKVIKTKNKIIILLETHCTKEKNYQTKKLTYLLDIKTYFCHLDKFINGHL